MNPLVVLALYMVIFVLMLNGQVAAQVNSVIVIVHPAGQDVELPCSVARPGAGITWIIDFNYYGVSSLNGGSLPGYSADIHNSNLIVKNIVMNDNRNNSEYRCVIRISGEIVNDGNETLLLYVAGVPRIVPDVSISNSTNENNVTIILSWGEPFINFDPIVSYTVSCSGDDTCPPNFTTTDNTTRTYTITNLTANAYYLFSVVATNSIGSGEAAVVMIGNPPSSTVMTTATTSTTTIMSIVDTTTTESVANSMLTLSIIATTTSTESFTVLSTSMITIMTMTEDTISVGVTTSSVSVTVTTTPVPIIMTTSSSSEAIIYTGTAASISPSSTSTSDNGINNDGTSMTQSEPDDETNAILPIIVIIIVVIILCCCGFMGIVFCFCCVRRENHYQDEKLVADPRNSFVAFVILGVLTFGISILIWFIYLRHQSNEKDKYRYYKITNVSIVVLGIYTCGISVLLWWMYKAITECGMSSSEVKKDPSAIPLSSPEIQSPRANEVPSVTNKSAEYDDTVATDPARAIQVQPDEEKPPPFSSIINETYEEHPLPTGYAMVDTKDVIARQNAVANAQPFVQHQTAASGEKYALPEKVAAKNTPIKYVELADMPSSGRIRTNNNDVFTPYAELC